MSHPPPWYLAAAAGFRRRLEAVSSDRWDSPSPCPGWTTRDVVVHSATVHRNVVRMVVPSFEADLQGDPGEAWLAASAKVQRMLEDRRLAGTVVQSRAGEVSFEQLVATLLCADTLVHTWDLARAAGLDDRLDPEAVVAAHRFLLPLGDQMRVPGGFGPQVDPPPGADAQTAFLCFTGRTP